MTEWSLLWQGNSWIRIVSLIFLAVLASLQPVQAQESSSSGIVGQVVDASQAAVPDAKVTMVNTATNASRSTTTNQEGQFSIPNLPPASYRLRVEKAGFRTAVLEEFDLRIGETARRSVTLQVGAMQQTVLVSSEAPILQTDSGNIGQVIDERQIEELPLNGRNLTQLAALSAGVSPAMRLQRGSLQYGERNEYVTIEGGRESSTNYVIDGVYARSLRFNNLSLQPSIDTVREFSVLRNAFSTEYGQGQSVVTAVTKSGSNGVHGTVFEFLRNDAMDARNYFAPAGPKPTLHRNQFGGTVGGPIIKDKFFVFGGYEGLRYVQGRVLSGNVPDPTQLQGNFSALQQSQWPKDPRTGQPFPNGIIQQDRISQFAKVLTPSIPPPNATGSRLGNYIATKKFRDSYDEVTFRADQTLSTTHSLFERYIWYDGSQLSPGAFNSVSYPQSGQNLSIGDTYLLTQKLVNELRLGYNRANALFFALSPDNRNWVRDLGLRNVAGSSDPIDFGRPNTIIGNFSAFGEGTITQGAIENIYSLSDTISDVIGRHTLRTGVQLQHRRFSQITEVDPRGNFNFGGAATGNAVGDYLLGMCTTCNGSLGSSRSHYRDNTYSVFINDVWQVHPRVTFDWGLRYEYLSPWQEQDNLEANFDPVSGKIGYHAVPTNLPPALLPILNTQPNVFPRGILQPDRTNFGPRLGLAFRASNNFVVRSGFGVFFDNNNLNELQFTRLVAPFYLQFSTRGADVSTLFPDVSQVQSGSLPAPFAVDPNNRTPYTLQWNLSIERTLARDFVVELAYTGSESHRLTKRYNQNQALPLDPANAVNFGIPAQQHYPFALFGNGSILTSKNMGKSSFHGFSAKVEKRYSHGLYFLSNFQWSKNIDNNSGEVEANDTAFAQHPELDRALSRFDQRYRSTSSAGYELPSISRNGILKAISGRWQIQGIVTLLSGFYFSPTANFGTSCNCGTRVPQRANATPGRTDRGRLSNPTAAKWFDPTAFAAPALGYQGNAGRNIVQGPGFGEFDFSLTRNFSVAERLKAQFRGEFFNLFNHPNLGTPVLNIQASNAGAITSAYDPRSIQFGLKLIW